MLLGSGKPRGAVLATQVGMDLLWNAGGDALQVHRFESREWLPWQPCHLPIRSGVATWTRRGRDILDSWTFPEARNGGRSAPEFDSGAGFGGRIETGSPVCSVPPGSIALRVAEIGPDGRMGPWLSIGTGSSYV